MSIRGTVNQRCELCGFTHHFYNEAGSCRQFGQKTFAEREAEAMQAKLSARTVPNVNLIMQVAGETGLRPSVVDLAVDHYLEKLAKETQ